MESRVESETRRLYLVEHYGPGLQVEALEGWASRVSQAAAAMERRGKAIRYVRSTVIPSDESFFCLFEAASKELVREAYARAGVAFDRVTVALEEPSAGGYRALPIHNIPKEEEA